MIFKLKKIEWYGVLFSSMTCWAIMLQGRIISLPFYLLFIGLCLSRRWHKHDWLIVTTAVVFFLSTFSPVDLYVPGWSGPIFGKEKSGTRFVRQVMGMPMLHRCIEKYGEFVAGGCMVKGFDDEAKWLLVMDWSGGTGRSTNGTGIPNSATNKTFQVTNSGG
jgi:hypothetical protein